MSEEYVTLPEYDPILERLDDQIAWYDRKSLANQRIFKRLKIIEISAAALIPLLIAFNLRGATWVAGGFGILITICEVLLNLNRYQENAFSYRLTCESLKHEKYAFLGHAGPYADTRDPRALLAERIESLVSQEHAKWASATDTSGTGPRKP